MVYSGFYGQEHSGEKYLADMVHDCLEKTKDMGRRWDMGADLEETHSDTFSGR